MIKLVISRHAEIYSGNSPLDWIVPMKDPKFDRKRTIWECELPIDAELSLYDGEQVLIFRVSEETTALKYKTARLEGNICPK